jgi:hypothetical protein
MNEYLRAFQDVTQSVEQLLADEHKSLEIKQSATKLKESVQPCFKELKQSATRLKGLIQVSFDDLYHAEDIWNSKPRIAQSSKQQIWEQLGEISGRAFRIPRLGRQCQSEAVKRIRESWNRRAIFLKTKWFTQASGNPINSIFFGDRSGFINDLVGSLNLADEDLDSIIKDNLKLIHQEIASIQIDIVKHFVSLLDRQSKDILNSQVNKLVIEVNAKFSNPYQYIPTNIKGFKKSVEPALEAFVNQNPWSINSEQVAKFSKEQVSSKMENIIKAVFDDRVKLGSQALEQIIVFYNDFLERQERYQQETPEQREAEKAWLDQQRQQLEQVQRGIEAILNAS